jgi:hypothetical protein
VVAKNNSIKFIFVNGIGDNIIRVGYFYVSVIAALVFLATDNLEVFNDPSLLGMAVFTTIQNFTLYGNIILDSIFIIPVTLLHCYDAAGGASFEDKTDQAQTEKVNEITNRLLARIYGSMQGFIKADQ